MSIAVFPFQIDRIDDSQGVFGRQVSQLIVEELCEAGLSAQRVTWYARKGEQVAHVALESALPRNVIVQELEARNASIAVLGQIRVTGETATLRLALLTLPIDEQASIDEAAEPIFEQSAPREMLPSMVENAVNALIRRLQGDDDFYSRSKRGETPFEAWNALLLDADSQDLIQEGGYTSLRHADHAWVHLTEALPWLPASAQPQTLTHLRRRIARWVRHGQQALALRAQRALAQFLRRDEGEWRRLLWLGEELQRDDVQAEATHALSLYSADPARASLALGRFLVATDRHDEAYLILRTLANHPSYQDSARTYLGIILAARGELQEASAHWQRVIHSGTNADMIEKSRRYLSRPFALIN